MEWFFATQRYGGDAVHRRIYAASAGRPVSLAGADLDGVPFRLRRDHVAGAAGTRLCHALWSARPASHDCDRRTHRARRLADPYHLGGDGPRHHGVGTWASLNRLLDTRGGVGPCSRFVRGVKQIVLLIWCPQDDTLQRVWGDEYRTMGGVQGGPLQ